MKKNEGQILLEKLREMAGDYGEKNKDNVLIMVGDEFHTGKYMKGHGEGFVNTLVNAMHYDVTFMKLIKVAVEIYDDMHKKSGKAHS